jgi:hypothetical protein
MAEEIDFASEMQRDPAMRKVSFNNEQSIENALAEASPDVKEYVKWLKAEKGRM